MFSDVQNGVRPRRRGGRRSRARGSIEPTLDPLEREKNERDGGPDWRAAGEALDRCPIRERSMGGEVVNAHFYLTGAVWAESWGDWQGS